MRAIALLAVLALTGCNAAAHKAEQRYATVTTDEEKCAAATDAAKAWSEAGDQQKYRNWSLNRDIYCSSVDSKRKLYSGY